MRNWLMVDEIIEMALILISQHELFLNPIVLSPRDNRPIRITKLRTRDGFDLNQKGLTLSIFPYSYQGTSNETTTSHNAAMVFEPFTVGSGITEGFDRCKLSLVVKLQTVGNEFSNTDNLDATGRTPSKTIMTTLPDGSSVILERSLRERYLYRWLTILRSILLTKPIADLGGLVRNSSVNWGSFRTTDWTGNKGENFVIHSAALLWQLEVYFPRNVERVPPLLSWSNTSVPSWTYVGVRTFDETFVYWDSHYNYLVTKTGFPQLSTPKGDRVVWNLKSTPPRFEDLSGTALTSDQLLDPRLNPVKPWINTSLIPVGVIDSNNKYVYYNPITGSLQLFDGTVIDKTSDNRPIGYDPSTGKIIYTDTNTPVFFPASITSPPSPASGNVIIPDPSDPTSAVVSSPDYTSTQPGSIINPIGPGSGTAPTVTSPSDLVTNLPPETAPSGTINPDGTPAGVGNGGIFLPGSGLVSTPSGVTPPITPSPGIPGGISIIVPGIPNPVNLLPLPNVTKKQFSIFDVNGLALRDTFDI